MHPGSFNATWESSTASGCYPLRMGVDSQERCAASHVWFDLVMWQLLLQERVVSPCLFTGEQHEQI